MSTITSPFLSLLGNISRRSKLLCRVHAIWPLRTRSMTCPTFLSKMSEPKIYQARCLLHLESGEPWPTIGFPKKLDFLNWFRQESLIFMGHCVYGPGHRHKAITTCHVRLLEWIKPWKPRQSKNAYLPKPRTERMRCVGFDFSLVSFKKPV